ncbi:MAG TPA: translocation/assembly module TamB domain-containing protein [Caulobacteraceae bacterium]|nr:translocation/assembly module TamB domain-containing protein [Caulobacteraceae bacterium]
MTAAAPTPKIDRRAGLWLLGWAIALTVLVILVRFGPATSLGRAFIVDRVNGLSLGTLGVVRLQGLSGDPWSDPRAAHLTITDAHGVWLDGRGVAVHWHPTELFGRRLRIESARVESLALLHQPTIGSGRGGQRSISIEIDSLRALVEMSPAFALRRGEYDLTGSLDLERSGAVRGSAVALSRLHAGDHLNAKVDIEPSKTFRVQADALEARGGALAGSLGLAADQPFFLTARAAGSADTGQVFVATRVGNATPLSIAAEWNKAGGRATGTLDLAATTMLAGYRSMLGPTARFDISGHQVTGGFDDMNLLLAAENLRFTARGQANIGTGVVGPGGLAVDARFGSVNRLLGFPRMGAGALVGRLTGDRRHWILTGGAAIDHVAEGPYVLARVAGTVRLENAGRDLLIGVKPAGQGGAGHGVLAAVLGARPSGSAELTRFADGRLLMRSVALQGVGLKATATGDRGLLGDLSFKGQASFSNLAVAHPGASGLVSMAWTARQAGHDPWAFSVDAHGANFAAGLAEADRLLGRTPHLLAQASYGGKAISLRSATLTGAAGQATGSGMLGDDGTIGLKLAWSAKGPFVVGPVEIDGAAKGSGDIAGTLDAPRADLLADFSTLDVPGMKLRSAHLVLTFQHAPTGADGRFALTAASDYGPAAGASAFRFAGAGLDLSNLSVNAGGVTASGALALRKGEPSSADLILAAGPGVLLSEGHVQGRARIVDATGGPTASLSLTSGEARLRSNGLTFKSLDFTADGPLRHLPYRMAASGPSAGGPWRIKGDGVLIEQGPDHVASFSGAGRVRRADLRTLSPAEVRLSPQGVAIRADLAAGAGRADLVVANLSGAASVKATLTDIDMSLLNEDYVGKLSGQLNLAGRGVHLAGRLDAHLSGASGRDLRGEPPVNGDIIARLVGGTMNVDFHLGNAAGLKAQGDVVLPVEASAQPFRIALVNHRPLSGRFSIDGEVKPLWDLTVGGAETLSGKVAASGTLAGTLADPRAVGEVALDNGRFQDEDSGLKLVNVTLRAHLADNAVDVSRFTAIDGLKGQVTGSGRASLQRDGVSSFRADLTGFRLIDTDLMKAFASGHVSVNRDASGHVQLTGALTIDRAQISPTPPQASGVTPMEVVEIHRPEALDDQLGRVAGPGEREAPIALDVSIRAPGAVFLKGRGLNLELALDSHVGGTAAGPLLTGKARVVRGDYNFAGQRFQIDDRGSITLGSTAQSIRLDLTATREDPSLTAIIKIAGTAARPTITLSSSPSLPQDEILSQVLFGASASQLSGIEAAQLASAVAGLAGGGGFDLIGGLRSLAHLDRLAVGDSAITGTTVYGGKYITDKLYLELTGGGREGEGAQLEWRVQKRLSLVGKLGSQGDSQIAVRWRRSY